MKVFMACLLLGLLCGITPPLLPAQQDQSPQHSAQGVESLKNRVLGLEKQLQIVENAEKMELQAKLAEANAKLLNAEFSKFERELRDANNGWLIKWGILALTFLGVVGAAVLAWGKSRTNQLIAATVEKNLNGFKETVNQVSELQIQFAGALKELSALKNNHRILEKDYTVFMLDSYSSSPLQDEHSHPEQVKALREETLFEILTDGKYDDVKRDLRLRYTAVEVLVARESSRKSPKLVFPTLQLLNSALDADSSIDLETERYLPKVTNLLARMHMSPAQQALGDFLHHLLTGNPKRKDLFLSETVSSLAGISVELNMSDSTSTLKTAIPHLKNPDQKVITALLQFFDRFNEPTGIEDLLKHHGTTLASDVEEECLDLLQKHNPEFVRNWRSRETTDHTES